MNINEATAIYHNPKGHNKADLRLCLRILNASQQPIELNYLQFEAIKDACFRLGIYNDLGCIA